MKTIAQQLNIKKFPFTIEDSKDNMIYYEDSNGWIKQEFDSKNNQIYSENSNGIWIKRKYDLKNNIIYYEDSHGYWSKRKYDLKNNIIYSENSNREIKDLRPGSIPEYTIEQLQQMIGKEFKIIK